MAFRTLRIGFFVVHLIRLLSALCALVVQRPSLMQTDQSELLRRAVTQRNQAIACAILSLVFSLALVMNTFLGHRKELVEAHQQILALQNDIAHEQIALRANQQELLQTQEALRREREALARAIQAH